MFAKSQHVSFGLSSATLLGEMVYSGEDVFCDVEPDGWVRAALFMEGLHVTKTPNTAVHLIKLFEGSSLLKLHLTF